MSKLVNASEAQNFDAPYALFYISWAQDERAEVVDDPRGDIVGMGLCVLACALSTSDVASAQVEEWDGEPPSLDWGEDRIRVTLEAADRIEIATLDTFRSVRLRMLRHDARSGRVNVEAQRRLGTDFEPTRWLFRFWSAPDEE